MNKTLDIVTSAFNEEDCIVELFTRINSSMSEHPDYDWRLIICDNGSTDSTWLHILELSKRHPNILGIRMSRSFTFDQALTCGLDQATADVIVIMASDLQDPPELISEFIRKWEEGYENIYMVVTKRGGTGPLRRFNSRLFYWVAARLTGESIPQNASDFRLVDRKVYEAVRMMNERNRFVRGLFAWVGFKSIGVKAERPPRFAGTSGAHSLKVIDLALKGIFAHSYLPLKLITLAGVTLSVLSIVTLVPLAALWLFVGVPFAGFGTVISVLLLFFGLLSFMIGIVAEYVGLVYEEVKQRPNFVVAEMLGVKSNHE